ncbi:MAG: NAD-dependent epimerase/dehydratase family protein [Alphaproteobacteria bacterium]|nr:NAD-dependent epimerase/dehydratase family protein [Alphaproteobacteria bacterium]
MAAAIRNNNGPPAKPIALVTGGFGFIGSHMVDVLLAAGYRVRVLDDLSGGHRDNLAHVADDPDVETVLADIMEIEPESPHFDAVTLVFHFAGIGDIVPSINMPTRYMDVNVQGTVRVLEAARRAGVQRFVYAASSSCYGLAATPTDEAHPIDPRYPYALSKYQGEQAVVHWGELYGLPVNAVRIFNAYGPRVRTTGAYGAVFGVFLKQKLAGKPLTVVGDGRQRRDFLYVTDVARAFLAVATEARPGEVFNLGAGNPQSILTLVDLLDPVGIIHLPRRPGEPEATWADISKITAHTSWRPEMSFTDGVAEMVRHIEKWRDAPLWDAESIATETASWHRFMKD